MLLYTFVPRYCDLYATLYTIKNHEIVEVNTVQLTDQSPAGKLAWLGIMTVDGVPYLHCQRLYDFNSQAYNYMWYRYGEDGLEVAADMGYYPAAGPRNDKWHTYACNFNGKQISNAFESVKSSEIKRLERNYPGTQLEALGLPEPGTVQYLAIGVKYGAATERPSYWGTGYMHNTLRMQKYNGSNYNAYSDSLNHLTLEEFTPYLEKMAELDRKK